MLGCSVRLPHIALGLAKCGAELNQKRFSAVILRTYLNARTGNAADVMLQQLEPVNIVRPKLDKIAVLIFRNGNLVCTGAKTFAQAQYMLLRTAKLLRDVGYLNADIVRMNIRNMVGRAQLPCRIDRERMARDLSAYATFDPEHFPGVVVRHPLTWPITLLIFDSGRVVVTGTKSKARADAVLERIKPLLMHFDINTPLDTPVPSMPRSGNAVDHTLYDLLGIEPDASNQDVKRAFMSKAKRMHPDKNPNLSPGTRDYNENMRRYRRVDSAYRVLMNPTLREKYDQTGEWEGVGVDETDVEGEGESDLDSDAEEEEEAAVAAAAAMGEHEDDDVDAALNEFLRDVAGD